MTVTIPTLIPPQFQESIFRFNNRSQGIDSASLCSLTGRYDGYDNPILTL
jgi:hypothetical protein